MLCNEVVYHPLGDDDAAPAGIAGRHPSIGAEERDADQQEVQHRLAQKFLNAHAVYLSARIWVRVLQNVEQIATLDVEDDVLEPDAALRPDFAFFAASQSEYFTTLERSTTVPIRHTLASPLVCPNAARYPPSGSQRQPESQIKNGPEIDDFRPVLELPVALANRRLRPLGHLTADCKCT
jgi:hypothetical protein